MAEPSSPPPYHQCHGLMLLSQLASPSLKALREEIASQPNGQTDDTKPIETVKRRKSLGAAINQITVTIPKKPTRRMDKTLGKIALGFLEVFSDRIGQDINLSDAASSLDVERRRIYDIVNVFESLEVVRRKAKNIYIYQGLVNLDATLGKLKALAHSQIDSPRKSKPNPGLQKSTNTVWKPRSDRSLGVLTQRFIMMFMESPELSVSLDGAAERLIYGQHCPDDKKNKNQLRRLYDIANILISLNLVERDTSAAKGKTRFLWKGKAPEELPSFDEDRVVRPDYSVRRHQKQTLLKVEHSPAKEQPHSKRSKPMPATPQHTPPSHTSATEPPNPSRVLPFSFGPAYQLPPSTSATVVVSTPSALRPVSTMRTPSTDHSLSSPGLAAATAIANTPASYDHSSSELITPMVASRNRSALLQHYTPLRRPCLDAATTPQHPATSTMLYRDHPSFGPLASAAVMSPADPQAPALQRQFHWPAPSQVYVLPDGSVWQPHHLGAAMPVPVFVQSPHVAKPSSFGPSSHAARNITSAMQCSQEPSTAPHPIMYSATTLSSSATQS